MKNLIESIIEEKGLAILDGALATELEARGANLNHSLWSAKLLKENPQLIQQVHYDYLMAGANIITTASYQASFDGFAKNGYSKEEAISLMRLSVQLALQAKEQFLKNYPQQKPPLIAASIGPYGASLADGSEYRGKYGVSIATLALFHYERMKILAETGADIFAFETIPCKEEAIALMEVVKQFPTMQAWISFSCKDGEHISSGESFSEVVQLINQSNNIIAVGVNCTAPLFIPSLLNIAKANTKKLIIVYPNKGETWDAEHKCWISTSAHTSSYIDDAKIWFKVGANIIGGCCRTNPSDIQQLQQLTQ